MLLFLFSGLVSGQSIFNANSYKDANQKKLASNIALNMKRIMELQKQNLPRRMVGAQTGDAPEIYKAISKGSDYFIQLWHTTPSFFNPPETGSSNLKVGDDIWLLRPYNRVWVTGRIERLDDKGHAEVMPYAEGKEPDGNGHSPIVFAELGKMIRPSPREGDADYTHWQSQKERDLGDYSRKMRDGEGQYLHYQKALEYEPTNAHVHDSLGIYWHAKGDHAKSDAAYKESIKHQPDWYHSYHNMATAHHPTQAHGEDEHWTLDDQLNYYTKVVLYNPLWLDAIYNIAGIMNEKHKYAEACYWWRMLRALNKPGALPERPGLIWNLRWVGEITQHLVWCTAKQVETGKDEL